METILDLATPEELENILGEAEPSDLTRKLFAREGDHQFGNLAYLYDSRGQVEKRDECIAKIQSESYRQQTLMFIHPDFHSDS